MPTANEIRRQFLDFFVQRHGHTEVPSSPVVPQDDPTLLFTNAGMNQFKDVFLGTGTRPYKRAVDSQKCIRAGGKHNDLDDVGKDTYHHTFFEMLGNWSFGDYYKAEAIKWAWELLTEVWKIDKTRLHATVFGGDQEFGLEADEEAAKLWTQVTDIDPKHVHRFGKKDNFWMMGDTGPCGPCSEIHFDRTPDKSGGKLVNKGDARVVEIWNLVFIQYNRDDKGKLTLLPAKHVDTGMGFERVTAVLQGKESNYDTDVFSPIMQAIGDLTGKKYGSKLDDPNDVAFRVIADHLRMLTFAITDGALPSNKGRGAVVRSVLRRAFRFGYQCFDQREPFIWKLVPALVEHMGGAYPELKENPRRVQENIKVEERDFLRTIERGLGLFEEAAKSAQTAGLISANDIFDLHTTYGFPPDLTRQMAQERGLRVDVDDYEHLMREHEAASRASAASLTGTAEVQAEGTVIKVNVNEIVRPGMALTMESVSAESGKIEDRVFPLPDTDDTPKWAISETEDRIFGWLRDNAINFSGSLAVGQSGGLVMLRQTCFYAEAGGQVGDKGKITTPTGRFQVTHTLKLGRTVVHVGAVASGHVEVGQQAKLVVDPERDFTRKNHTATHLLNWALREVLGEHVEQKGSLVDAEKTRFDFTHDKPLSSEEIAEIERLVNEKIYADLPVTAQFMPLAEAKKIPGVRAVFGEKYPDPVRVLLIGVERPEQATRQHSVEFCGGTHLRHTGEAGFFKVVAQEPVAKGVRRVTAVTGREAVATVQRVAAVVDELTGRFNCKVEELPKRIDALQDEIKKLQQQLKKGAATDMQGAADKLLAAAADVGGAKVIVGEMPAGPEEQLRQQVDRLRQKAGSAVVVLGWADDGKVGLLASVTDDLVKKGLHAGKLVGKVAEVVGGRGGGKPTLAQAGGKDATKLGEALALARQLAGEQLAK